MEHYFAAHKDLNLLNPESHRIFRKLVEDLRTSIFMADATNRLFYTNPAFNELFEFASSSQSSGMDWSQFLLPDRNVCADFLAQLGKAGFVRDFETVITLPHGRKDHLLLTANLIYSDQGMPIGVNGFALNISYRHKLMNDIRIERQKLEEILTFCNNFNDIYYTEDLTAYIVQQTAKLLGVKRCSLMFVDTKMRELYIGASCGIDNEIAKQTRVKIGDPVCGMLALRSHPVLVNNIEQNEIYKDKNKAYYTGHSFMSAPIIYKQKLIGIINVSERDEDFTVIDLKILETIAQQSAVNIEKSKAMSALELLSQTDSLTGLFNRRVILEKLQDEINRSSRYNTPLSVMMVDADNFKAYNDAHGHPEGDALIRMLASIFKNNLRGTELIGRYGGDEFIVILPMTSDTQAFVAAEKIRTLAEQDLRDKGITLSIGIAQYQTGLTREDLIVFADNAMYQSKNAGRNKVSVYSEPRITKQEDHV